MQNNFTKEEHLLKLSTRNMPTVKVTPGTSREEKPPRHRRAALAIARKEIQVIRNISRPETKKLLHGPGHFLEEYKVLRD